MTDKQPPTEADIRQRVEEIAVEAEIDTADKTEPITDLIDRVRNALQEEFERVSDHYSDLDAELDQFEEILAEHAEAQEASGE